MNVKNSPLLDRFARVHGDGPFEINEFCAITGLCIKQAEKLLLAVEQNSGRALCLAPGFYILKPLPAKKFAGWYNWNFNLDTQRRIFDACASWQSKSSLYSVSGLKSTALDRYLRAMVRSGNLETRHTGLIKIYRARVWRSLTSYASELPSKAAQLTAS